MPRTARNIFDGGYFHVVNRGNDRAQVFSSPLDYRVFLALMKEAKARFPLVLLGFCLMPNHFHLLIKALSASNTGAFVHWATTCHSRYHHGTYGTSGHVWQGRFKSLPIEREEYLITALRYIEGNPKRAGLVRSNQDWEWSSLSSHCEREYGNFVDPPPFYLSDGWLELVETPLTPKEFDVLRKTRRDSPPSGTVP